MINFYTMEKFWLEYELKDLENTLKALEMNVDFINSDNGKFIDEENTSRDNHINTTIQRLVVCGNVFSGVSIDVNKKIMREIYKLNKDKLEKKIKDIKDKLDNIK